MILLYTLCLKKCLYCQKRVYSEMDLIPKKSHEPRKHLRTVKMTHVEKNQEYFASYKDLWGWFFSADSRGIKKTL